MTRGLNLRHILEDSHFFGTKPEVRTKKREVNPNLTIRTDQYSLENGHRLIMISRGNPKYYSQRIVLLHYDGAEKPHAATKLDYLPEEGVTTIDGAIVTDIHPHDLVYEKLLLYAKPLIKSTHHSPGNELEVPDSPIWGF